MRYRVEGKIHIWGWIDFKTAINGTIIDYKTDGCIISWIDFETDEEPQYVERLLRQYGLRLCNNRSMKGENVSVVQDKNEPMTVYMLAEDKQRALVDWINNNFIKMKTINKDKTSNDLKELFVEFPITNGQFKGAMVEKCRFQYDPNDGVNWYFNISKKSPVFLK